MSKLTKAEQKWLSDVQRVLDKCPSKRLGFATTGDRDVTVFDLGYLSQIGERLDRDTADFVQTADAMGAVLGSLKFPAPVESTAG